MNDTHRGVLLRALPGVLTAGLILSAQADFKVVQKVTVKRGGASQVEDAVSYYRGRQVRTDRGKSSSIFDLASKTVTTLNHDRKTYTVLPIEKFATESQSLLGRLKMSGKANIKPAVSGPAIAGKATQVVQGTIEMTIRSAKDDAVIGTSKTTLRQWATTDVPKTVQEAAERSSLVAAMVARFPEMKSVGKQMSQLKGLPLKIETTTEQSRPGQKPVVLHTTIETVALKEQRVDGAMFVIPKDYRRFDLDRKTMPKVEPIKH